ncbi:major facilitator superfamily domain-containing protein [Aspergillus floccosus]
MGPRYLFRHLLCDHGAVTQEIIEATYEGNSTEEEPYVVSWIPNDPRNPLNFNHRYKQCIACLAITGSVVVAFGSSTYAGGMTDIIADLQCSREVAILGISLFVLGFGVGPIMWGPLSEIYGRRLTLTLSLSLFAVFSAAAAGAQTIQALVVLRFFASSLGSAPWAVTSGMMSDMFPAHDRGLYSSLFSATALSGPALGPIRPFVMLFGEPIVLLLSTYISIVYGILYLFFDAFPYVFQDVRGWSPGLGGLSFVGVFIGTLLSIAHLIPAHRRYRAKALASPTRLPPEERLPPSFAGSICMPVGLFWFAWTNSPSIHWMAPIAAGVPFGFGLVTVFMPVTNYLVDSYTIYAASVIAGQCLLRSSFACVFPLFTPYMYRSLGIHWASCVPAFLSLVCAPLPFLFYKYGAEIRKKCHYSAEADAYMRSLYATAPTAKGDHPDDNPGQKEERTEAKRAE